MITGFVCGVFDLLHPGHVIMLSYCKGQCDRLVVGLQTDPSDRPEKNTPAQTTYERYVQLAAHRAVDMIIPYDNETDLVNILATSDIQIRFLGSEYRYDNITGLDICNQRDIKIVYVPRLHSYSSSELIKRIEGNDD